MKTQSMQCTAHKCWCGNKKMKIRQIVRDETDNFLALVDYCGVYVATGGYTEHWAGEADFCQEYNVTLQGG